MDFIFSASTHLKNIYNTILDLAILGPLRNLYFDGPTVLGVGFWEKLPQKDICSRLTGVSATFWDKADASEECKDLLSRKFDTFIVGAFTLGYIWVIYKVFSYVLFRVFVLRPITNEIKEEMRKVFQFEPRNSDERESEDTNRHKNKNKD
jgi:hypothetical protein